LDLWSLFLAPGLAAALLSTAPPRPRRGRVLRARGRKGGSATLLVAKCTPCHWPQLPRTRAYADRGRLARRHPWRWLELRRVSRLVAPFAANAEPSRAVRPTRAHTSARPHTRVHAPWHREGAPAPPAEHRRRADVTAPTPATTSPRRPPPSSSRSFEPNNPRGSLEVTP
jgi:hypothetical protein